MALKSPFINGYFAFPTSNGLSRNKKKQPLRVHVSPVSLPGSGVVDEEEVMRMFLKDRQESGDLVSRVSDIIWRGGAFKVDEMESSSLQVDQQDGVLLEEDEDTDGFLKLSKTREWLSGDNVAPANRKSVNRDMKYDREKWKKFNLLKYGAIKRELLLLTIGIGSGCCIYCLVVLSIQAAFSYAAGVFFSCLYLQLLYYHADNLSKEKVPKVFMQKRAKKIGIRSEDIQDTLEKTFYGSTMVLSSPRLVLPAAIYGLWILSQHIFDTNVFEIVPAMLGFFAYKAAALVQVYRDNEDLRLIFPDESI